MKNFLLILFLFISGVCTARLQDAECRDTLIDISGEIPVTEIVSGGLSSRWIQIDANICPSATEYLGHSKTGKSGNQSFGHDGRPHFASQLKQLYTCSKKGGPIIHSVRSADRYVLELERIII